MEENFAFIVLWDRVIATNENQINVISDISAPYRVFIVAGVSGLITCVNKLKKNNVAFGFNILVRKPILMAANFSMSAIFSVKFGFTFFGFERKDLYPINIRYPAPRNFIIEKRTIDFEIINPMPINE